MYGVAGVPQEERAQIEAVQRRLAQIFEQVPHANVAAVVEHTYGRFDQCALRDFVPLLVERRAREELARSPAAGDCGALAMAAGGETSYGAIRGSEFRCRASEFRVWAKELKMDVVRGTVHAAGRTVDASVAAAGAVNGAVGGFRGVLGGMQSGLNSGSRPIPAVAAVGAAGPVEWPLLLPAGGTLLGVHYLTHRSDGGSTQRVASLSGAKGRSAPNARRSTRDLR